MHRNEVHWFSPLQLTLILLLAFVAMPLHELGHWLWGTIIDGREQILQFTKVTGTDGSLSGSAGGIFAGPLMSALLTVAGVAMLLVSKDGVKGLIGATLALMMAFQRLTIYFASFFKGMAGNDEGIVANWFGLHDWALALPLAAVFVTAIAIVWRNAPVRRRGIWFAVVYVTMFVGTLSNFWLDSVLFG